MINVGDKVKIEGTGTIWDGKQGTVDWIDDEEIITNDGRDFTTVTVAIDFETKENGMRIVRQDFDRQNVKPLEEESEDNLDDIDDVAFDKEDDDIQAVDNPELDEGRNYPEYDVEEVGAEFLPEYTPDRYNEIFEKVLVKVDKNETLALEVMGWLDDKFRNYPHHIPHVKEYDDNEYEDSDNLDKYLDENKVDSEHDITYNKNMKIRENADVNAAMEVMSNSIDIQDDPCVGPFWYDVKNHELFGVESIISSTLNYYHSKIFEADVRTGGHLHYQIWKKNHFKGKDSRFNGDYKNTPRGRVFEFKDKGFKVMAGEWINEYPEVKELIISEYNLPVDKTEFVIDSHWNIGSGWEDELK